MPDVAGLVTATENALRELVVGLAKPKGREWTPEVGVSANRIAGWKEKREEEKKRRPVRVQQDLIYFSELHDLGKIILKHWERFEPILGKRGAFVSTWTGSRRRESQLPTVATCCHTRWRT
jgi:hypothetical protein